MLVDQGDFSSLQAAIRSGKTRSTERTDVHDADDDRIGDDDPDDDECQDVSLQPIH